MIDSISNYGPRFNPPSCHEIRVKCLKEEVKITKNALEVHRTAWKDRLHNNNND